MSNVPETAPLPVLFASEMRTQQDDGRPSVLVEQHVDLASRIIRADRLGDITPGKERALLIQTTIRAHGRQFRARNSPGAV